MAENKIMINRVIEKKAFLGSDVEIIIPFYGQQALVSNAIQTIFQTVISNRYLITLVDDGSENDSFKSQLEKARITGVRCLYQENKGFGSAVNLALQNPWKFENKADKIIPYVVIMHSDVSFYGRNWLLNLGTYLETMKSSGVKMVSPVTNNPVENFEFMRARKGQILSDKVIDDEKFFLPLYCSLCHRDLFNHVGLIKEMPYASYEAQDYAKRMREKEFKQAVCGTSWVKHEGGSTLKALGTKAIKILRNNKEEL